MRRSLVVAFLLVLGSGASERALAAQDPGVATPSAVTPDSVPAASGDVLRSPATPRIGGRVQARYEYRSPEAGENLSSFYLRRVRIDLRGELLDGRVSYRVMPELAGAPSLRDGWIEYAAAPMLRIRAGQFAAPFQWLRDVSGSRQHFAERGIASEAFFGFPGGYDIGVGVHGRDTANTFKYAFGIFDGAGRNVRFSNSAGHMASGRVTRALAGQLPTEEPDLAYSERVQFSVGGGIQGATLSEVRSWDLGRSPDANERADWLAATADVAIRWRGLSIVPSGYLRRVWPDDPGVEPYTGFAHVVSAGYFPIRGRLELVGRQTRLHLDSAEPGTRQTEWSAGVNVYHLGHGWKTQIDYTRHRGPLVPADHVVLVQMQLLF